MTAVVVSALAMSVVVQTIRLNTGLVSAEQSGQDEAELNRFVAVLLLSGVAGLGAIRWRRHIEGRRSAVGHSS